MASTVVILKKLVIANSLENGMLNLPLVLNLGCCTCNCLLQMYLYEFQNNLILNVADRQLGRLQKSSLILLLIM